MENTKFLIASILFTSLLFFQFIPKVNNQLLKTNLRVTIQDDLGNIQEGAMVTLYDNNEDYRASENPVAGPVATDKKGRATFKDLEEKVYFVHAEKGKLNNNGLGVQTDSLEGGKLNKAAIVIQ